jgi:DNA-binding transcriptional LysR family regulator
MDARPFDWSDLEIFLAAARGGSLAAAAGTLRVDASTVQRRIGKLESAMRTRLFERSQRGYSLTSAGEDLLAHALAMDEHVAAARRKVVARDAMLAGTVRVATVDDLAITILPPILKTFRDAHPHVTTAVDVRASLADLARQQADVALRFGAKPPEGDVIAKHVSRIGVALYASRSYVEEHGRPRKRDELAQHTMVRGDESMAAMPFEQWTDRWADPTKTSFRSESFFARLAAIREGMGIGYLGCFMGDREKALRRLPIAVPQFDMSVWLLVHVDMRKNARVRAFVEHTYAALVALRPLFEGRR